MKLLPLEENETEIITLESLDITTFMAVSLFLKGERVWQQYYLTSSLLKSLLILIPRGLRD